MSLAIIVQQESNTSPGGSALGFLTGTDSTSAADTFYGRRLTDMLLNENSAVSSFTPSTGGTGVASTAGQITLVPGTYRIEVNAIYGRSTDVIWGLYNVTDGAFEVYTGGSTPILGTVFRTVGNNNCQMTLLAGFTVVSSNKTFEIRHKGADSADSRALTFCGNPTTMTTANVNTTAALNLYCVIKILKTA